MAPKDRKGIRQFGTGVPVILLVVAGIRALLHHDPHLGTLGAIAAAVAALAWIVPVALLPVYRAWMLLAEGLLWINTRILLALVFYGMVTPTGLLMRLFGRDPMERRFDRRAATYWSKREPLPKDPARFRRQY
jgi:hypothetical protein